MRRLLILITLLSCGSLSEATDKQSFDHVKIHRHRSADNRVLVDKVGVLTFDDTARQLIFRSRVDNKFEVQDKVDAGYDAITKIVFEVTTHMRGGGLAQVITAAPLAGPIVGPAIAGQHVHDYWFFIEYKNGDQDEQTLLEVPKDCSEQVITKATALFGSRVSVSQFPEEGQPVKKEELTDLQSKHSLNIDKSVRPTPEAKPDKATIVVVCPPLAARYSGRGNQFKLHANDRVVAVNRAGTYTFAYLDPGKYRLVSQSENANGFEMELEAGKTYYLLQNTFQGAFKWETSLSRNSPELVTYLMSGTYFSIWARK